MTSPESDAVTEHCGCITCGDQGVPMAVLRVDRESRLALCSEDGGAAGHTLVDVELVDAVTAGDVVLVHAGTALARLGRAPGAVA